MPFPIYKQLNQMDCGPTCLRMIAKFYGRHYNAATIREKAGFSRSGVSMLGISETAEKIGFKVRGVQITVARLSVVPLPAILHWNQGHFVVLYKLTDRYAKIADPDQGKITYSLEEFEKHWISNKRDDSESAGTVLLLEPSLDFYENLGEKENKLGWKRLNHYLWQNCRPLLKVAISLLISFVLQLILPFLTQSMVDTGINGRNISYITIVLFAQLALTLSTTMVDFIRSRLQMRISNKINISILSDFWIKLTRLPISYFDSHHTGDIIQRLGDNKLVQSFLTGQTISTAFALLNFVVYSIILMFYSTTLFFIFLIGNLLYFGWINIFLRIRRKINYETFYLSSKENNSTIQLIQGMQEIRLNNAELRKRWEWENIQVNVFKLNFKSLNYTQWQTTGGILINQAKDIFLSFTVAQLVVRGELSFGTMLAVQYIIGQLSGPIAQFIGLSQSIQDAKISLERLNEIHNMDDEEPREVTMVDELPNHKSIILKNVTFTYPGAGNDPVLNQIDLLIPEGKVTAIVGVSGSGKTTFLKLMLKIFDQYEGKITVGDINLKNISPSYWRSQCGAVLQDGFIFNDTIARNIAVNDEIIDREKLHRSCETANIWGFINSLPNGMNTKLGAEGIGISQGQRQRILIARSIYKNPQYLFFDEATNSLDANNERTIVENLGEFFKGRTVITVAHRLSTVRNADNIVVLDNGQIIETGDHSHLVERQGAYFQLIKNQLELGS